MNYKYNEMQPVPHGQPIPYKLWMKATDAKADYCRLGEKWNKEEKPRDSELYNEFCKTEKEYNKMADLVWFGSWTDDQRKEWESIGGK